MEIAIAIIGSGIITKLIDVLIQYLKERKDPMKVGLRMCLLKNMQDYGKELINQGFVNQQQLKAFEEGYKAYKDLGGDGFADRMNTEVHKLKIQL